MCSEDDAIFWDYISSIAGIEKQYPAYPLYYQNLTLMQKVNLGAGI